MKLYPQASTLQLAPDQILTSTEGVSQPLTHQTNKMWTYKSSEVTSNSFSECSTCILPATVSSELLCQVAQLAAAWAKLIFSNIAGPLDLIGQLSQNPHRCIVMVALQVLSSQVDRPPPHPRYWCHICGFPSESLNICWRAWCTCPHGAHQHLSHHEGTCCQAVGIKCCELAMNFLNASLNSFEISFLAESISAIAPYYSSISGRSQYSGSRIAVQLSTRYLPSIRENIWLPLLSHRIEHPHCRVHRVHISLAEGLSISDQYLNRWVSHSHVGDTEQETAYLPSLVRKLPHDCLLYEQSQ